MSGDVLGVSLASVCSLVLASGSAAGTTGQTRTLLGRGGKSLGRDPERDPGCDEELAVPDEVVMAGDFLGFGCRGEPLY